MGKGTVRVRAALIAGAVLGAVCFVGALGSPASALTTSNFVATGHDMDYHCSGGDSNECAYLQIVLNRVRNGSSLPVLTLDHGAELTNSLMILGIPFDNVDPNDATALNATALVDGSGNKLFSAIVTASDQGCGGCDNDATSSANINARTADIKTFFNAGGGILALAGGDENADYYNFVPLPNVASTPVSAPFTVTSAGSALGITDAMANCCATHNSFLPPSSPLVALETDSAAKTETIAAFDVIIGGGGFETTTVSAPTTLPIPVTAPIPTVFVSTTTESTTTTTESTTTTTEPEVIATEPPVTEPPATESPTIAPTEPPAVAAVTGSQGVAGTGLARTGGPLGEFAWIGTALIAFGAAILLARRRLVAAGPMANARHLRGRSRR